MIKIKKVSIRTIFLHLLPIMIMIIPYAKIKIGIPFYFIDFVIATALLLFYKKSKNKKFSILGALVFLYWVMTMITAFIEGIEYTAIEPIYMLFRYSMGMALIVLLPALVENLSHLKVILKVSLFALMVNSFFCLAFAVPSPITTGVKQAIFSKEILYPQKQRLQETVEDEGSSRGQSLAGNANTTAYLISIGIILVFGYSKFFSGRTRSLLLLVVGIGLIAIITTLSRAAYLSLVLIIGYISLKRYGGFIRRYLFIGLAGVVVFFSYIGIENEYVDFTRIIDSVNIISGEQELGYSEQARVLSYTVPFQVLAQYPKYWFIGRGIALRKLKRYSGAVTNEEFSLKGGINHFYFASILYERGFLAALIFTFILVRLFYELFLQERRVNNPFYMEIARMLFIALILPLAVSHYLTDSEPGNYMLFFNVALILRIKKILV